MTRIAYTLMIPVTLDADALARRPSYAGMGPDDAPVTAEELVMFDLARAAADAITTAARRGMLDLDVTATSGTYKRDDHLSHLMNVVLDNAEPF